MNDNVINVIERTEVKCGCRLPLNKLIYTKCQHGRRWAIDEYGGVIEHPLLPPIVVCLCGSTRFWKIFQTASLEETLAGKIVLSIGAASATDDEHFGNLPREEYDRIKSELDILHFRKIDMSDVVFILNVNGYIGESTQRELDYARALGKQIRFLEDVKDEN